MLAAAAGGLFVLLRGPAKIRLVALFSIPVLLAVLLTALPPALLQRYATAFTSDAAVNSEAMESSRLRKYLLQKSIEISIQNPLFGIGINQFPNYEGSQARARGEHGAWLVSHNSYTQLSSETGFPGLLLVLAATISTFRLLNRLYGYRHRPEPAAKMIANAAFCLMLSQVVFGVAIFFLAMAYGPNLLILSGFAVSLHRVALRELPQEQRKLNPALQPSLKYAPR
jgi:O-antigen ligase